MSQQSLLIKWGWRPWLPRLGFALLSLGLYGLGLCSLSLASRTAQAQNHSPEMALQIKAQFVYNFANYVEWPSDAFANGQSPIRTCLFGEVDFAPYLLAFEGVLIGQRPLQIVQTTQVKSIETGCHILFVGEDRQVDLPDFWSSIQYLYVLSIGEMRGFADNGGIINIFRTSDRLQFDVNISNALINGLFLDSDLLALARTIKQTTLKQTTLKQNDTSSSTASSEAAN